MKKDSCRLPGLMVLLLSCAVAAQAAAPPKRPKNVPKEAHWRNGSWFQVVEGHTSWTDAKKKCEAVGGNLAVVPDEETWKALKPLIPDSDYWLGASDAETTGKWKWVDGSSMTYAPWRAGEPNNVGGKEHWLVSSWGDVPEDYGWTHGYVCQWKTFDSLMAYRADVEDSNAEVAQTLKRFREEMIPAIQAHHTAVLAADEDYITALTKEMEASNKRNDAPAAEAIEKEIALINAGTPIHAEDADGTPPALVKLRKAYREQCWKADEDRNRKVPPIVRRYDPYLGNLQAKILHDGSASQAMEVKMIRQSMQGLLAQ
jgi:hypothetical protein